MTKLCPTLATPWNTVHQAFPSFTKSLERDPLDSGSIFLYSGEPTTGKKKKQTEKPTINRLSIWISYVFDLFLLKNLSECCCGLLTGWGFTLEGSSPSYGLYAPFHVQSLLRFPFLTSHNSTWLYLEEELELSWFHLQLLSHIKVYNAILVGFFCFLQ